MLKKTIRRLYEDLKAGLTPGHILMMLLGALLVSFGVYNIHRQTHITEGGVLGMILLIHHWFGLDSSVISPILDVICYAAAIFVLGRGFLLNAMVATSFMALSFRLWESFPPFLPDLSGSPLLAAVIGGLLVGIGSGLIIRGGGSGGGDDALALTISKVTGLRLYFCYMFTDLTVLLLSLSYIPARRIAFSLVTVTISSYLVDLIADWGRKDQDKTSGSSALGTAIRE